MLVRVTDLLSTGDSENQRARPPVRRRAGGALWPKHSTGLSTCGDALQ